ncbi:uncharacterized protein LOC126966707 [Leptidea sinapis]|uniref:uncharacterized protein LOC126966707 n=1 Tax=Leptidea sinapis TaxID=189913 RepID=UPI0021C4A1D3|nr:uncharacterized protein LOC126966707 [Leptidea sinapis]
MKLYVLLALCVLQTHAASISAPEKKLDDLSDIDLENVVSEPELVQQTHAVKDIDNSLRSSPVNIPVKVIVENVKLDENSNDYVPDNDDSINLKRAPIDLKNPGPPQRQQHETQNPEHYTDGQKAVFTIKQSIEDTQKIFSSGLKGISDNFKKLFANDEQLSTIQENINKLKITFGDHITKLNDTIQSHIAPEKVSKPEDNFQVVEARLKNLASNFDSGVSKLNEGVELLAIIKEEDEAAAAKAEGDGAPAEAQPSQPSSSTQAPTEEQTNFIYQFLNNFQNGVVGSFTNLQNAVQNYFGQNPQSTSEQPPEGVQADTPQGASSQGGNFVTNLFQGISFPSLPSLPFLGQQNQPQKPVQAPAGVAADEPAPVQTGWRPPNLVEQVQNSWNNIVSGIQQGQAQQQAQPAPPHFSGGPIAQTIQGIVYNWNRPTSPPPAAAAAAIPEKPAQDNSQKKPNEIGSNSVPTSSSAAPKPEEPAKQSGPVQQIVQNNPIVKGIQTAVQRLRNPERPRDEVPAPVAIDSDATKGHGGSHNGDIDSNRIKTVEEEINKIEEKPSTSEEQAADDILPLAEPAKTE